jgi:prolipoprotein diacylglyceryltransferase
MPVAALPGPLSGIWRLGPVTVHGYALCAVLGILVLLWLTERRYRAVGGRRWLIIDFATVAVPAGLIGARIYRILIDYQRYFGPGKDWVGVLRIWDGGLGLPGAAVAGVAVVWLWCKRQDLAIGPVLAAAAPGIAVGAAISLVGNWFAQSLYGPPSTVPWAVPIAPSNRLAGYQDFSTFQPLFGYEAIWDAAVGVALIYLIRRVSLTGDRALAICVGGYAIGVLGTEAFVLAGPQQDPSQVIKLIAALAVLAGSAGYLYVTRAKLGPEPLVTVSRRWSAALAASMADDSRPSPNASRTAGDLPRNPPSGQPVPQQAGPLKVPGHVLPAGQAQASGDGAGPAVGSGRA